MALELDRRIKYWMISSELHVRKPDAAIYEAFLARAALMPRLHLVRTPDGNRWLLGARLEDARRERLASILSVQPSISDCADASRWSWISVSQKGRRSELRRSGWMPAGSCARPRG